MTGEPIPLAAKALCRAKPTLAGAPKGAAVLLTRQRRSFPISMRSRNQLHEGIDA